jgi:hypothetical protein
VDALEGVGIGGIEIGNDFLGFIAAALAFLPVQGPYIRERTTCRSLTGLYTLSGMFRFPECLENPKGFEVFESIQDPRNGGNTRHHFGEILFIAFAAVSAA